ncbi:amidohydrolase family protein [Amycolatopsis sp. FDAARGOS 1241]|uniref:amidohydrolase family protein n=1 Tax=Amycolatopsis sp. FDAARGOS 1241 TaxID=2778070 RepID=UPI00194F146B|nr:amidohydrolase family protein [Amycolatopsis sp. FDAARGOS 1241]QRP50369.1 amidohydrolase family protein [Amycolatopsis sp. FDAARGOS 1241]
MTTIDVHAHLVPAALLADLAAGRTRFPNVRVEPHGESHVVSFVDGPPTRPVSPGLTDLAQRGAWLGEQRIERQLVGGWLDVFGYQLPAAEGADWAEHLTAAIVEQACEDDRLLPLGTVPLQDPARAAAALTAQRAAGVPGVMIATRAGGRELDDPAFTPFWEAADVSGAIVFLHPGFGGASERYTDFGLVNGLARLEDTTVTLARLLYAGIPARYPGVKVIVAHGGAALPYVLGRLTRNHLLHRDSTADPVESFGHLYFDSVLFDPSTVEFLVAKTGAGRVLLGSDYPFPIGDLTPRAVVETANLKPDERSLILGGTAAALLELS